MIYPPRRLLFDLVPKAAVWLIFLIGFASCQKEEIRTGLSFEEINLQDIKAHKNQLSTDRLPATDADGLILEICEVLLYRTNSDHYGKLKVLNIDFDDNYLLTIQAVTYRDDGTILSEVEELSIRGTYTCDLDAMLESGPQNDFHWRRENDTDTALDPIGAAVFMIY